jgi:hypothetical protein
MNPVAVFLQEPAGRPLAVPLELARAVGQPACQPGRQAFDPGGTPGRIENFYGVTGETGRGDPLS